MITWYIQSNINALETEKMIKALDFLELPYHLFKWRPFSEKMPKLNATPPFVLIGSTKVNEVALKSPKYKDGVFFNDNFKPSLYKLGFGEDFINSDMSVYKIKDVPKDLFDLEHRLFIRSNDDSKQISGGTILFKELLALQDNTFFTGGDMFTPESEVCLASVKSIYAEYRLIICKGKIIGSSRYQPSRHYSVPDDVLEYAYKMIHKWAPHDVYVMDICETDQGLKVIECNCVNGAGWYESDYVSVIGEISEYVRQDDFAHLTHQRYNEYENF